MKAGAEVGILAGDNRGIEMTAGRWRGAGWPVAMVALFVCGAVGLFAAGPPEPRVTVREAEGTYSVTASFAVSQPASAAISTLTDYERIPRFMPDVRSSQVLVRSEDHVVVEQEALARFMMFSKAVHVVLEIQLTPGAIRFRDRCGRSFSLYEGSWTISERDGYTAVTYELSARPSFDVPQFVLTRLLKRDATRMIERLQQEIAARAQ